MQQIKRVYIYNRINNAVVAERIVGATVSLYTGSGGTGTLVQRWDVDASADYYEYYTAAGDNFDSSITATAVNGAYCSDDGMVFDGTDDTWTAPGCSERR